MNIMRHVTLVFLILIVPLRAQAALLDIQEVTSPSGITAWLVEDHAVPVIALQFTFKNAGAALEPADKQGLARLVSNTMDEGAGDLTSQEFQKELQDLSIDLRFNSGRDNFGGAVKTLTKNKGRAFELLGLALREPRFDDEPFTRMKNANMGRIRSSLSDPEWIAARIQNDKIFAGHPYAQNSGGTLTSLANITPDDLRAFTKNFSKDGLVVAAAGDISPRELETLLDEIFGHLPQSANIPETPDITLQNQGGVFVYERDIPQTVVDIIQPGIDRLDPDYQIAQVMNFILGASGFGSRLMKEVREKRGLTYGIYTGLMDMDHFDGMTVSASTKNESVGEVIKLVRVEWNKMREQTVSEQELKNAKAYLIGSLPLSLTSTDKIAGLLLSLQEAGLPVDYLDQREKAIESATVQDVQRVAQRLLDTEKFVTVLVGKPEGVGTMKKVETLPNVE